DEKFTANMEKRLDDVESGNLEWKQVLRDFYPDFKKEVDIAHETLDKIETKDEVTEEKCEKCGANMVVKYGPYGKFLACPNFPDCRFTKNYIERTGYVCPKCGKAEIIKLRTKKGRIFYGCENKDCDFMAWQIPKDAKKLDGTTDNNTDNNSSKS
ncbi:MAG: topoisomerase DNA-binding C4 zinc finger domain-containing protein, partial [Lachnospiraceae bacterium]|nr:topoisomerase DNA-binding C4 zinc finger domain-containing protein [Lachnospiraceae bacterium]